MSDVDILRRAAALMRERAGAATPGPWSNRRGPDEQVVRTDTGTPLARTSTRADRRHIASWHPGVAVPVANMLEAVADAWLVSDPDYARSLTAEVEGHRDALVVARAYLGESA